MKVGAIVPCRLDSSRLPGKAFREIAGQPMLRYVLSACRAAIGVSEVVVATTQRATDDRLATFVESEGYRCFRGDADDVAGRFLGAMRQSGLDAALRLNGDSPLAQTPLLERGLALFAEGSTDLATNVPKRTFPFGLSVEVVLRDALERATPQMSLAQREHVTQYFYDHSEAFRLRCFEADSRSYQGVQLAVDTPLDLERAAWIVDHVGRDAVSRAGVARLVELSQSFAASQGGASAAG